MSSLPSEGAVAQCPKTVIPDCQRKKGVCVCVCVCVCFGVGEREDSKLHNSREQFLSLKKKLHIAYSQASYSQTDASNRRAGDEGQSCTPRGEDGSLAAASAHGREDPPHAAAPDRPPPPKDCVLPTIVQLTFCSKFCSS